MPVIFFMLAIFSGWVIFDFVKHKKLIKENVISAFVASIIAGIVWYILLMIL